MTKIVEDYLIIFQVEDMRLIIHNLGKFLSHRDVKVRICFSIVQVFFPLSLSISKKLRFVMLSFQELVQSALLESNTGRDDHILYDKLVRMTNI